MANIRVHLWALARFYSMYFLALFFRPSNAVPARLVAATWQPWAVLKLAEEKAAGPIVDAAMDVPRLPRLMGGAQLCAGSQFRGKPSLPTLQRVSRAWASTPFGCKHLDVLKGSGASLLPNPWTHPQQRRSHKPMPGAINLHHTKRDRRGSRAFASATLGESLPTRRTSLLEASSLPWQLRPR